MVTLLTHALVKNQLLQGFVSGEGVDPAASLVVLGQGDGQLRNHALGGTVDDRLLQQTLGQMVIMPAALLNILSML